MTAPTAKGFSASPVSSASRAAFGIEIINLAEPVSCWWCVQKQQRLRVIIRSVGLAEGMDQRPYYGFDM